MSLFFCVLWTLHLSQSCLGILWLGAQEEKKKKDELRFFVAYRVYNKLKKKGEKQRHWSTPAASRVQQTKFWGNSCQRRIYETELTLRTLKKKKKEKEKKRSDRSPFFLRAVVANSSDVRRTKAVSTGSGSSFLWGFEYLENSLEKNVNTL